MGPADYRLNTVVLPKKERNGTVSDRRIVVGNCCVAVAVAGDRWWDADQAFPVRGHGHTMEPALAARGYLLTATR